MKDDSERSMMREGAADAGAAAGGATVETMLTLARRLQGLEEEAAEIKTILRAILTGIERLNTRLPHSMPQDEVWIDGDADEDGFLMPPPGYFLN